MIKNKKVAFVCALHQSETHRPNGFELFNDYLTSIYTSCKYPFKLFAFDNASDDEFEIENCPDNLSIIRIEDQYVGGCTYAWNEGIKMSIKDDYDVVIITSDDQIYDESVNNFVDTILTHELKDNAIFGPLSNEPGPGHSNQKSDEPSGRIFEIPGDGTPEGNLNGFCLAMTKESIQNNYFDSDGNFFNTGQEYIWGKQDVEVQTRVGHSIVVGTCYVYHKKQGGWREIREGLRRNPSKNKLIPVRYSKKEININLFEEFFKECGKYTGKEKTDLEVSGIWERVISRHTTSVVNVFDHMEKENLIKLKEIYENYYAQGVSEGASSGKALSNYQYKFNKAKRNIGRVNDLRKHLNLTESEPHDVYKLLFKKYNIPDVINVGQTWGWQYGDNFVHFELADYLYFLDIIIRILDEYNLDKTMFIGDGSGLLSTLVYNNYNIKSSHQVDLGHFLLKQYLTNYGGEVKVGYHYAENFQVDFIHDSQILINQDSFPEMTTESVEKYVENAILNNVSYILSYNKEVKFEGGYKHSDFRASIIKHGYISKHRYNSVIREGYVIELFGLEKIKV